MSAAPREDERRWRSGIIYQSPEGLRFRVVQGKKSPDDLRVDVAVAGSWRPVRMELLFFLMDFFFENEEYLYPPPKFKGGLKILNAARTASMRGYRFAQQELSEEQRQKAEDDKTKDMFG